MNDLPQLTDPATWKDGWQTRDGRLAEIAWDNMRGDYPLGGRIEDGDHNWVLCVWKRNGCFRLDEEAHATDIIPRPRKHGGWLAIAVNNEQRYIADFLATDIYSTEKLARIQAESRTWTPLAIIPISFYEGEGLEGAK